MNILTWLVFCSLVPAMLAPAAENAAASGTNAARSLSRVSARELSDFAIGADLSFLKQAEDRGVAFQDAGQTNSGLRLFRDHGYNWIRLRLFNHPTQLPNNLDYTLALAKTAKQQGYKFLLDFHYSDTWADPGKQFLPQAWEGKSHSDLVQAVFEYTRDSIAAFREGGALPDMVQIGNEVIQGMLWPDGRLPGNWDHFADLVRAGVRGVDVGRGEATAPRIMIHIDRGGDAAKTKWFFDQFNSYGIPYDVIGQSYYPFWHGTLEDLRRNLAQTAEAYGKQIIVVEAAYNWRPAEYRNKPAPFPESPKGQEQFLEALTRVVLATPRNLGLGVFWWEPAVNPASGLDGRSMFNTDGSALPVLAVYDGGIGRFAMVGPKPRAAAQSAPAKPVLYLIGDSTVRNGTRGQMGWGDPIAKLFDPARISVVNRALGGRSSRTYLNEGLWDKVLAELKTGDYVLMQFGHNDGGALDDSRARASLKGGGPQWQVVTNQTTGKVETVHTYGWYLRKYISDAKDHGAIPIVLSLVPRKIWKEGRIVRATNDYAKWAAEAANSEQVSFVDLNDLVARHYEALGEAKVNGLFGDEHTHTTPEGALLNARCVLEGLRGIEHCPLIDYFLPATAN